MSLYGAYGNRNKYSTGGKRVKKPSFSYRKSTPYNPRGRSRASYGYAPSRYSSFTPSPTRNLNIRTGRTGRARAAGARASGGFTPLRGGARASYNVPNFGVGQGVGGGVGFGAGGDSGWGNVGNAIGDWFRNTGNVSNLSQFGEIVGTNPITRITDYFANQYGNAINERQSPFQYSFGAGETGEAYPAAQRGPQMPWEEAFKHIDPNREGLFESPEQAGAFSEQDWMDYDKYLYEQQGGNYGQGSGGYGMEGWGDMGEGYEWPDPTGQAQEYLDWMKEQRVNATNTQIDAYLRSLGEEEQRVNPYYEKLYGNLGVTREAALSGSEATTAGINELYTKNRLELTDARDNMRDFTTSNLMSRGMLNSGQADKAFRNIDKSISSAISTVMKQKNLSMTDVLEGKGNVQTAYTTAIKNAQKEQQEYLAGLARERTSAEGQRGRQILNIGNELAAQLPVLSRQIGNDQFSQRMQMANLNMNQRMATANMRGRGSSGPSWIDQMTMKFKYDQMKQQERIAGMQSQPNMPGLGGVYNAFGEFGMGNQGYDQNLTSSIGSGMMSGATGVSQQQLEQILNYYNLQNQQNQQNQQQPNSWRNFWGLFQ